MVATVSTMVRLGTKAPDFSLPDAGGKTVSLSDFDRSPALLVIFMCNHCPYVKHVADGLAALAREYQQRGVAVVGINSNDAESYPDDAPERMAEEVSRRGYTFPYLVDETQEVARAYQAACTPDFYVFDKDRRLVYRGQMDSSRPGNEIPVTGEDLRKALDAVLSGRPVAEAAEGQPRLQHQVEAGPGTGLIPRRFTARQRRGPCFGVRSPNRRRSRKKPPRPFPLPQKAANSLRPRFRYSRSGNSATRIRRCCS